MRSNTVAVDTQHRWDTLGRIIAGTSFFIIGMSFIILGLTLLPIFGIFMGLACFSLAWSLWTTGRIVNTLVLIGSSVRSKITGGRFIPLAILSLSKEKGDSYDFDATTVDVDTIRIGPNSIEPLRGPVEGVLEPVGMRDVDADGQNDLVVHFPADQAGVTPNMKVVCFTGQTKNGTLVRGCGPLKLNEAA
jgi:hypothetical protein